MTNTQTQPTCAELVNEEFNQTEQAYKDAVAQGKDITTSKQIMATGLWGGQKGLSWVNRELKKLGL